MQFAFVSFMNKCQVICVANEKYVLPRNAFCFTLKVLNILMGQFRWGSMVAAHMYWHQSCTRSIPSKHVQSILAVYHSCTLTSSLSWNENLNFCLSQTNRKFSRKTFSFIKISATFMTDWPLSSHLFHTNQS